MNRQHTDRPTQCLRAILSAVEQLNRKCFERAISLTTAIAWGEFSYHQRIVIPGIDKAPIYGNAYISAYADSGGNPKLYPNECRVLKRDLPEEADRDCLDPFGPTGSRMRQSQNHFYFEWMRPSIPA